MGTPVLGTTVAVAAAVVVAIPAVASAATPFPSDFTPPNLVKLLGGFSQFWKSDGADDLYGSVVNAATLKRNDQLAVWINNNATKTQRFHALQDSEYNNTTNTAYDHSLTISTALGSVLGPRPTRTARRSRASGSASPMRTPRAT